MVLSWTWTSSSLVVTAIFRYSLALLLSSGITWTLDILNISYGFLTYSYSPFHLLKDLGHVEQKQCSVLCGIVRVFQGRTMYVEPIDSTIGLANSHLYQVSVYNLPGGRNGVARRRLPIRKICKKVVERYKL